MSSGGGTNDEAIRTRIWREEAEADDPGAVRAAWCHGYDVYGEMLGRARWVDMLYLLFRGEAPLRAQGDLLEALAVALANPGPCDESVHAAMCGGACGSPTASSLMAALAVGAGSLAGGREVFLAMEAWAACGTDIAAWRRHLGRTATEAASASVWPAPEHPPGFAPRVGRTATTVRQTLACLAGLAPASRLAWLGANLDALEAAAGHPLALSGVAAAAFADLGLGPDEGEALHLLLRLPGAAAHALEQHGYGHKKFPFFAVDFEAPAIEEKA